jgi:pimeloyl-ACP methyl ester carboxylesterase
MLNYCKRTWSISKKTKTRINLIFPIFFNKSTCNPFVNRSVLPHMKNVAVHTKGLFVTGMLLLFIFSASAQSVLTGTVKDLQHRPIAYCSLGIKNSKAATVADERGAFRLIIPDSLADRNLVFSAIGFVDREMSPGEINKLKEGTVVILEEKIFDMAEVVIKGTKLKEKTVGQRARPMITFSKMFDQHVPSIEQGNVFEIEEQSLLKAYNFYIMPSSKFSSITLKLNLYAVRNNLPDTSLLRENITYRTTAKGWQHIDLTPYQLGFNGMAKIALTLQLVEHQPDSTNTFVFGISAKKTLSKDLLFRYQSQGNWENNAGAFIANLEIKYNKEVGKAKKPAEKVVEETSEVSMLADYYQHKEAAQKSGYGKRKNGRFIDLDDAKIYTEEYGEGEPLLLLHGNNGSISDFYLQIPFLAKHFKVIAIDTRGQGRSTDLSTRAYSYDGFAADLYKIISKLGLKKVNIVGWSDGGNTALSFNLAHPEMVKKIVAIGANLNPSGVKDSLIASFKQQIEADTLPQQHKLIRLMLEHPHIEASQLKQISNPVLVIAGSDDVIKPEHTQLIASQISGAQLEIIPNATHYVPFEKPAQLNQAILHFLALPEKDKDRQRK